MTKDKIRNLVGVYSCALTLMSLIIPVPVLAQIAKTFPEQPVLVIQLLVTIPNLVAIPTGLVVAKMADRVYKKYSALFFSTFYVVAGTMPIYLHDSMAQLILSSCLVGVALGGMQNAMTALIPDIFEPKDLGLVFGLLSTFVGIGGVIYTAASAALGAGDWTHAFYAYFIVLVFVVLEALFLPKGKLERHAEGEKRARVPREIMFLCFFGFVLSCVAALFTSNCSMLIDQRGLGSVAEAGLCTSAYTLAGIVAGLITAPLLKIAKRHSPTLALAFVALGLILMFLSANVPTVFVCGLITGIGYNFYTPVSNMGATNYSGAAGTSFNIALCSASIALGSACSPVIFNLVGSSFGAGIDGMIVSGAMLATAVTVLGAFYFSRHDVTVNHCAGKAQ